MKFWETLFVQLPSHRAANLDISSCSRPDQSIITGTSPIRQLLVCRLEHGSPDSLLLPHLHRAHLLSVMADEGAPVPSHHCPLPLHHEVLPCCWLQNCLHFAHRLNSSTTYFSEALQGLAIYPPRLERCIGIIASLDRLLTTIGKHR